MNGVTVRDKKTFYCLRCDHRFPVEYDPKEVVERSCPKCGSNSVRLETPAAVTRREAAEKPA
jgi:Zn finger protein HypA/HybF involved in hydrogenase expression